MPLLHWLTRDADLAAAGKVPYRLIDEVPELGRGDPASENLLVQGDNLDALKALLPFYGGQVKCIYIDPPYNTRSAFEHYDDNLEHALWLSLMVPRLQILWEFLKDDGSIWVNIDDHEGHYLKVIMDNLFHRGKFIANMAWQKRYSRDNNAAIGDVHEHILVYAKEPEKFKATRNRVDPDHRTKRSYSNPNNDPRGPWQSVSFTGAEYRANMMYPIEGPDGSVHYPPEGRHWAALETEYLRLKSEGRIWFGRDGKGVPRVIRYLSEVEGLVPWSWLPHDEVGHTGEAKQEVNAIFGGNASFATPKPERLIQRILQIATNPGDIVLDSFLGSGTTAAVAHKMGRRWIGIEMGPHARTHCVLRLGKVVEGEKGGISEAVGWAGGGGFRFATLGKAIFDGEGRIAEGVGYAALARHVWFAETHAPMTGERAGPFLGVSGERGIALLWNGVLKDRSAGGGNVLTRPVLRLVREDAARVAPDFSGPVVVYAAACRLSQATLEAERIVFKQTPYDISERA